MNSFFLLESNVLDFKMKWGGGCKKDMFCTEKLADMFIHGGMGKKLDSWEAIKFLTFHIFLPFFHFSNEKTLLGGGAMREGLREK